MQTIESQTSATKSHEEYVLYSHILHQIEQSTKVTRRIKALKVLRQ